MNQTLAWILFNVFVAAMLVLDLGVIHRRAKTPSLRNSLVWTGVWIAQAAAFAAILYGTQGRTAALEFSTGYVIELSLSADNLFIFLLVFRYFRLPEPEQYRVLFWGIIGAIVMRFCGFYLRRHVGLIRRFHWIIYGFGPYYSSIAASGCCFSAAAKSIPTRIHCCACCADSCR